MPSGVLNFNFLHILIGNLKVYGKLSENKSLCPHDVLEKPDILINQEDPPSHAQKSLNTRLIKCNDG